MRGIEWLKSQCNRYKNGQCTTLKCMQDGGYKRVRLGNGEITGNMSHEKAVECATCEPHEILIALKNLEDDVISLQSDINNLTDSI